MEHVVLHAPGHPLEGRNQPTQEVQFRHLAQHRNGTRRLSQDGEHVARTFGLVQLPVIGGHGRLDRRCKFRRQAVSLCLQCQAMADTQGIDHACRHAHGVAMRETPIAQAEAVRKPLNCRWCRRQTFFPVDQQSLGDPAHAGGRAEVGLHHLLDRQILAMLVGITEQFRQFALVIEQQPLFAPLGRTMQAKAHARERATGVQQSRLVRCGNQAGVCECTQVRHVETASRHPAERIQIAQGTRPFLQIGLKVERGVVVALVATAQFVALGVEEFHGWPDRVRIQRRQSCCKECGITSKPA